MALRTYGSDTLNDNWAEERSKALRGVLSDFGHREYDTTHKTAFPAPSPGESSRKANQPTTAGVFNMSQACTMQQAVRSRPVEDRAFSSLFSRTRLAAPAGRSDEAETTTRAAFGVPKRVWRTALRALPAPNGTPRGRVRAASAQQATPEGRSTAVSRPIGERFMESEEPAQSTAAQRSWVYNHDAVIKYHEEGVPVAPAAEGLSVNIGEGARDKRASNNRSRSITLEREPNIQRGTSVWVDFHVGPGEA